MVCFKTKYHSFVQSTCLCIRHDVSFGWSFLFLAFLDNFPLILPIFFTSGPNKYALYDFNETFVSFYVLSAAYSTNLLYISLIFIHIAFLLLDILFIKKSAIERKFLVECEQIYYSQSSVSYLKITIRNWKFSSCNSSAYMIKFFTINILQSLLLKLLSLLV